MKTYAITKIHELQDFYNRYTKDHNLQGYLPISIAIKKCIDSIYNQSWFDAILEDIEGRTFEHTDDGFKIKRVYLGKDVEVFFPKDGGKPTFRDENGIMRWK